MLQDGTRFVDFELPAHDGTIVRSTEMLGRPYLLYFYPKANTPGWIKEACQLRDSWSDLRELGLEVYGVSYDTPETNRAFAEREHLPFLLLSDTDRTLAKAVGAAIPLLPFPKRISYLIGADGTVLKGYPKVTPATHAEEVLEDFREMTAGGTT